MSAIVIDDLAIVDIEFRPIVGHKLKAVIPRLLDPEATRVINGEPFGAVCDPGETGGESPRRDVQAAGVYGAHRLQVREIRQLRCIRFQVVDLALKSGGKHHGGAEYGDLILRY